MKKAFVAKLYEEASLTEIGATSEIDWLERLRKFSIIAAPVKEQGNELQFGDPQTLVSNMNLADFPVYDVAPGGKKILLSRLSQQGSQSATTVTLLTNFAEGLNSQK